MWSPELSKVHVFGNPHRTNALQQGTKPIRSCTSGQPDLLDCRRPLFRRRADGVANAVSLAFELRLPSAKTADRLRGRSIESAEAGEFEWDAKRWLQRLERKMITSEYTRCERSPATRREVSFRPAVSLAYFARSLIVHQGGPYEPGAPQNLVAAFHSGRRRSFVGLADRRSDHGHE